MASIAVFSVAAATFPLGSVFDDLPEVTVELERIVPTGEVVVPYFWIYGADSEAVLDAFYDKPGVLNIELVDSIDESVLMRAEWDYEVHGIKRGIFESGLTLLSASGSSDEWRFELRAPDRVSLSAFQSYCQENCIGVELTRLYTLSERRTDREYGLTEPQLDGLTLAFDRGYFDSPRRTTLEELADELGVSRPAVSDRLRRGLRNLLASTIAEPD
ncbi:helix-turn-helix domain-containing protein [Natronorarus salvus]|uniref:helix-turn-helix domain-containing protein n=1 Tax=Natronorarus salvus TaxID=3117733 RepID=UPI002F2604A2